ncbi:unnamed protein product [Polarella glacialis]|uniref:SnoaL-like domain-containing protein n=1 Tax=Polarella glacialis TaxID=89957 RepID=A0A813LZM1_POLGL|nr:unnamed protein product [Polarella glacialis]
MKQKAGMAGLWHKGDHSCCIHASSRPVHGFKAIVETWPAVFRMAKIREARHTEQSVAIRDNIGRAVCCQTFSDGSCAIITNHFECSPQGWKLCCHQVSTISEPKQTPTLAQRLLSIPDWIGRRWRMRKEGDFSLEQLKRRQQELSITLPVETRRSGQA